MKTAPWLALVRQSTSDLDFYDICIDYVASLQDAHIRRQAIATSDFGVTRYTENVGVRPDIELDYMTKDNLLNLGASFVASVTGIMLDWINQNSQ